MHIKIGWLTGCQGLIGKCSDFELYSIAYSCQLSTTVNWTMTNTCKVGIPASQCPCLITTRLIFQLFLLTWWLFWQQEVGAEGRGDEGEWLLGNLGQRVEDSNYCIWRHKNLSWTSCCMPLRHSHACL